jgi:hypothetical protein
MCVSVYYPKRIPRLNRNFEVVPDSDHLDSEDEVPTGRKRKVSKAALAKQKAAAKKRAKKQNGDDDDDDDHDDDEDEFTAPSKSSLWTNKSGNPKPPVGSIEKCAKCSKAFTVVRPSATLFVGVPIHDCERPSTPWPLTLHPAFFATPVPGHLELSHSRSLPLHASASPLPKGRMSPTTRRTSSLPWFRFA